MATLKELQDKYNLDKSNYDSSVIDRDNKYNIAIKSHTDLFKCVKGKGTTSNCPDGQPLPTTGYPAFGDSASTASCKICNATKNCETDCCKEDTCVARVNDYNSKIGAYSGAATLLNGRKQILDASEAALKAHPDYTAAAITAGAMGDTLKIVAIIAGITVAIVVIVYFLKKKGVI